MAAAGKIGNPTVDIPAIIKESGDEIIANARYAHFWLKMMPPGSFHENLAQYKNPRDLYHEKVNLENKAWQHSGKFPKLHLSWRASYEPSETQQHENDAHMGDQINSTTAQALHYATPKVHPAKAPKYMCNSK